MQPILDYFNNIPRRKLVTRGLIIVLVLIVAAVCLYFTWDNLVNHKKVTLIPSGGTTITIGEQKGDEPVISKQIASTNVEKTLRLRTGTYALKFSASKDYEDILSSITIDDSTDIKTPTLNYTVEKLKEALAQESVNIQKTIWSIVPQDKYDIDIQRLFGVGEWYGARLIPKNWYQPGVPENIIPRPTNSENRSDILRVILKKDKSNWKIAAGPSVIFYIKDYPKVPEDIIRAVNKLGFTSD